MTTLPDTKTPRRGATPRLFVVWCALCVSLLAACTRTEWVDGPQRENSVTIGGVEHPVERIFYRLVEIEYPASPENATVVSREAGVAVTVVARGVTVKATVPLRLVGKPVDLERRDERPNPDGHFHEFHLSQAGGIYCRVLSWLVDEEERRDDFAGRFIVSRGSSAHEYLLEWELRSLEGGNELSRGYVRGIFKQID